MTTRISRFTGTGGFTLVEVIVAIMAAAILGAIFINYMGTAMSQSTRAIEIVRDEAGAEALIEQIVADYVYELNRNPSTTSPTALSTLKGYIEPPTLKYGAKVSAQYIKYKDDLSGDEENPTPALSNTLKVTVAASGNDLIILLTQSRVETKNPAVPF
jgi:prepilin-type N-terminal cleavage/methylation domain-containing protein